MTTDNNNNNGNKSLTTASAINCIYTGPVKSYIHIKLISK